MKIVKLLFVAYLMSASFFHSAIVMAHTDLSTAEPSNGSVINLSPGNLSLTFTEDVRLLKVSLINSASEMIEIDFVPSADAAEQFFVLLPQLKEDSYKVEWAVLGSDSHRVEGEFSFTFDSTIEASNGEENDSHSGHHD